MGRRGDNIDRASSASSAVKGEGGGRGDTYSGEFQGVQWPQMGAGESGAMEPPITEKSSLEVQGEENGGEQQVAPKRETDHHQQYRGDEGGRERRVRIEGRQSVEGRGFGGITDDLG